MVLFRIFFVLFFLFLSRSKGLSMSLDCYRYFHQAAVHEPLRDTSSPRKSHITMPTSRAPRGHSPTLEKEAPQILIWVLNNYFSNEELTSYKVRKESSNLRAMWITLRKGHKVGLCLSKSIVEDMQKIIGYSCHCFERSPFEQWSLLIIIIIIFVITNWSYNWTEH